MSGRFVIIAMAVFALVMSVFFYRTLKTSPQYKELAVEQMMKEFKDYTKTVKKTDQISVGSEGNTQFFVKIESPWKFEIQDRTLVVFPPVPESIPPGQTMNLDETKASATKSIQDAVKSWLVEKYHSEKDLLVEVRY